MMITDDANLVALLLIGFVAGTAAASLMGGAMPPQCDCKTALSAYRELFWEKSS